MLNVNRLTAGFTVAVPFCFSLKRAYDNTALCSSQPNVVYSMPLDFEILQRDQISEYLI